MINSRERVLAALRHEEPDDRIPIQDSPWAATIVRWLNEGLPTNIPPADYFGYEVISFGADCSPRFPTRILEETAEYIVETTATGGVRRNHRDFSTTPEIIDYAVKTRADWEHIKERLTPSKDRVDWGGEQGLHEAEQKYGAESVRVRGRTQWIGGLEGCRRARKEGKFVCYSAAVGYDLLQSYIATPQLLMTVAEDPDWMRDMYKATTDLAIEMCEVMKQGGYQFDGAFIYCDLGYKNGTFFSPRHYEDQLHPTFQRLYDYFNQNHMPVILHSCGDVRRFIPYFIKEGLSCLQPLEVKAGMDVIALKEQYGDRLAYMGGIDVRNMALDDPSAIEAEIKAKITAAKRGGGYIYHSDHSIPNNVSLKQYQHVLELVHKYGRYGK
jgi:uroporphyrinogen decarboxylase